MSHPSLDAEARDPGTTSDRLFALAQDHPELHAALVRNPHLPDVARHWILTTNPEVRADFEAEAEQRRAAAGEGADGPDRPDAAVSDVDQPTQAHDPVAEEPTEAHDPVVDEPTQAHDPVAEEPTQAHDPVADDPGAAPPTDPRPAEPFRSSPLASAGPAERDPAADGPIVVAATNGAVHHRARSSHAGRHLPPDAATATASSEDSRRRGALWPALFGFLGCLLLLALVVLLAVTVGRSWLSDGEDGGYSRAPETAASQAKDESPSPETTSPKETESEEDASPAPENAQEMTDLVTPSGNITCTLGEDSVGCTVGQQTYDQDDGCEDGDFAITVGEEETEKACGEEFASTDAPVLQYGSSAQNGDTACTSESSGITCWNVRTGHGFMVSRSDYETF